MVSLIRKKCAPNGNSFCTITHFLREVMKITYAPEVDVLRILFSNAPIEESDEDKPGVIIDYDKDGNIVGFEILDASKRMGNPRALEYEVIG